MKDSLIHLMAQRWPRRLARLALLREWSGIGEHKYVLADIALRGGVFGSLPRTPGDVFQDGINEGRRQLAIEIIEQAGIPHDRIYALLEKAVPSTERERP